MNPHNTHRTSPAAPTRTPISHYFFCIAIDHSYSHIPFCDLWDGFCLISVIPRVGWRFSVACVRWRRRRFSAAPTRRRCVGVVTRRCTPLINSRVSTRGFSSPALLPRCQNVISARFVHFSQPKKKNKFIFVVFGLVFSLPLHNGVGVLDEYMNSNIVYQLTTAKFTCYGFFALKNLKIFSLCYFLLLFTSHGLFVRY